MNTDNQPVRVRFVERQTLRTADLTDEQAYHLEMRRRHNLAFHTWGIARGLELALSEGKPVVRSGMAIDGYGRELILAAAVTEIPQLAGAKRGDRSDVWLEYNLIPLAVGPGRTPRTASPDPSSVRLVERPSVRVSPTSRRVGDPNSPPEVAPTDVHFTADRVPPDLPEFRWPVFLGEVEFLGSEERENENWRIDSTGRRYAGVVASRIVSPPRPRDSAIPPASFEVDPSPTRVYLQNGPHPANDFLFAIHSPVSGEVAGHEPSLAVTSEGHLVLNGREITFHGDLVLLDGSALKVGPPPLSASSAKAPHRPWSVSRHASAASDEGGANPPKSDPADPTAYRDELRISMESSGRGENQVAIGYWSEKNDFKRVLTVKDNGNVIVDGNLIVQGGLAAGTRPEVIPVAPEVPGTTIPSQAVSRDMAFDYELRERFRRGTTEREKILAALKEVDGEFLAERMPRWLFSRPPSPVLFEGFADHLLAEDASNGGKKLRERIEPFVKQLTSADRKKLEIFATALFDSKPDGNDPVDRTRGMTAIADSLQEGLPADPTDPPGLQETFRLVRFWKFLETDESFRPLRSALKVLS